MKLDTSSYYPKSPLDDNSDDFNSPYAPKSASAESDDLKPVDAPESSEPSESAEAPESVDEQGAAETPRVLEAVIESVMPEESPIPDQSPLEPDQPPTEGDNFVTGFSHLLSWVLVPLLMPVYGVMLAFGLSILSFTSFSTRLAFTVIVAAFNLAIPAFAVLILKYFGLVKDVGLNGQRERFLPYLVTIACMVGTAIFMAHRGAPMWLVMFFYGGAATGLIEVVINRWWKISAHAAGIAGIVALLVHMSMGDYIDPDTQIWLMVSVGLAGLLGSARIWLGRHTLGQVLAGYCVGFCAVFFLMYI